MPLLRSQLCLALGLLALAACDRGAERQADQEALRRGVASDERVVAALQQVDDLALKGKPAEAVALLESRARPASRESAAVVGAMSPATAWGQERHRELKQLVTDRSASLDRYAEALRGEVIERVLSALEEQKSLDQRGAALAASVARGQP